MIDPVPNLILFKTGQPLRDGWFNIYCQPATYYAGKRWKKRAQAAAVACERAVYRVRVKVKR